MVIWWLCISSSGKTKKFDFLSQIWPWRSRSIATQTILTKLFSTSVLNLVILAPMGNALWCRQYQNGVNSDFKVKFGLEGQGQLPRKTIGTLTKVFCTFGSDLVILAWTGPDLLRGQANDYRTHGRTDGRTDTQTDAGNDNTSRSKLASVKN